jgi:RNA polymerase sigma-70 factor (ECF subfamily)
VRTVQYCTVKVGDDSSSGDVGVDRLFREYASYVRNFLRKRGLPELILDDAVQEVFLVAYSLGGYRQGPASPSTWLCVIAVRVAANARRKLMRNPMVAADRVTQLNANTPTADYILIRLEELSRVRDALNTLTGPQRDVFIGFYVDGDSCETIAKTLEVPIGTVYSRLHVARNTITTYFSEHHD